MTELAPVILRTLAESPRPVAADRLAQRLDRSLFEVIDCLRGLQSAGQVECLVGNPLLAPDEDRSVARWSLS